MRISKLGGADGDHALVSGPLTGLCQARKWAANRTAFGTSACSKGAGDPTEQVSILFHYQEIFLTVKHAYT